MASRYKIGYYYERKTLQKLEDEGFVAWRTPGSHTPIDVIAIKNENGKLFVKLIQIKATSNDKFNIKSLDEIYYLKELYKKFYNCDHIDIEIWVYNRNNRNLNIYNIKDL